MVEPLSGQVWQKPLAELPDTLAEQLRSTNMEFFQQGETLCFIGGYGRSETLQDHTTYPYLTLINVPTVMDAVVNGDSLAAHFRQVRDTFFAVTGGQLQLLADTFYLVGGHRFEGLYSANAGSSNVQVYTNAIRKFTLQHDSAGWHVDHKSQVVDELNLHRRDYNLVPQIFENGESGISAFSGVFQPGLALLPFLNAVEIGQAAMPRSTVSASFGQLPLRQVAAFFRFAKRDAHPCFRWHEPVLPERQRQPHQGQPGALRQDCQPGHPPVRWQLRGGGL
ncbi:MAG: hypothetical protein IPM82_28205 [Saprospiraceae bacterium]|nr:hypothetical protein [Saprospiraceae bacterium]